MSCSSQGTVRNRGGRACLFAASLNARLGAESMEAISPPFLKFWTRRQRFEATSRKTYSQLVIFV